MKTITKGQIDEYIFINSTYKYDFVLLFQAKKNFLLIFNYYGKIQ